MIIRDEKLLAEFREPGPCEWCGKWCKIREPAHIFAKGLGGGSRLDIRENLVALGATRFFCCPCHTNSHNNREPTRAQLLEVAAKRESTTPEAITDKIYRLLRQDKFDHWEVS